MPVPFFFEENLTSQSTFVLSEETSKHVIQVLRMQKGEEFRLTNGKGHMLTCQIIYEHKKAAEVKVITNTHQPKPPKKITVAISLIKNKSRFEWFLEKATEIGVSGIIPLVCERTEKQHFRYERMRAILISAMLQSQQVWLPLLSEPVKLGELVISSSHQTKYIAHCIDEEKKQFSNETLLTGDQLILIGPEGDFTKDEVDAAVQNNFIPVSLGNTRLRTETAGIVACVLLNDY
ncbi:MAG: RsmE family RNA methyltransferase [Ginsengibacter sp.]